MKNLTKDKFVNYLTLSVALVLSTIAAYYSVVGLVSIFSGEALAVAIMGSILELSKIVTTLWLHQNWKRDIGVVKGYLTAAVVVLMMLTSVGIFGFLSKSHLQQSSQTTVSSAQVEFLENSISSEQARLNRNQKQIDLYSNALSSSIGDSKRSAVNERTRMQKEIAMLQSDNKIASESIAKYQTELLPLQKQAKMVEVEFGPLIYVSKLIYGENFKDNLDKTVQILILCIIFVFDPLAVLLLVASQSSFWYNKEIQGSTEAKVAELPIDDDSESSLILKKKKRMLGLN